MVREIDAGGFHSRQIRQELQITNSDGFRQRAFDSEEQMAFDVSIRKLINSQYNNESFVIKNVLGAQRMKVLVFPQDARELLDTDAPDIQDLGMPKEGETYSVIVENVRWSKKTDILVIVDNPDSAKAIATRNVRERGWMKGDVIATPRLLSPDEFIEYAKVKIDLGVTLPINIKRYGGLAEYQRQHSAKQG